MIESTIDKTTAKAIYKSKAGLFIYAVILGIGLGIYKSSLETHNYKLTFGIVLPVTLVIAGISIFIGIKIGIRNLTGTKFQINETEIIKHSNNGKIIIPLEKIRKVKKLKSGILVTGPNGK